MNNYQVNRLRLFLVFTVICLFLPSSVFAHIEQGQAAGFTTGLAHPWSGLDHILAMVAVGLWGAQLGNPAIWVLPIAFPMMMAAGGMMGLLGIPVPGVEAGIAVSAIILGLMVLLDMRAKLVGATLLVGFFAIFHGYAHGTELPAGQSALLYSMGFVIGTGCLHGVGILIGLLHRYRVGKMLLRGAGAFIMIMGCLFLWQAVS